MSSVEDYVVRACSRIQGRRRFAFTFLTDLAALLGATLHEADEDGTLVTPEEIEEAVQAAIR